MTSRADINARVRARFAITVMLLSLTAVGCNPRGRGHAEIEKAKTLLGARPEDALKALALAERQGADALEVKKGRAAAHERLNQLDQAETLLREVLQKSPNDLDARLSLARLLLRGDKLAEALSHLKLALKETPPHVPSILLFSALARTPADAEFGLSALARLDGEGYRTFRRSAEYLAAKSSLLGLSVSGRAEAMALLSAPATKAFESHLALALANALLASGKERLALWLLARDSSSADAFAEVHEALAELALRLGELRDAESAIERLAVGLRPDVTTLLLEARLAELRGRPSESTHLTKRALESVPAGDTGQRRALAMSHARALLKERLFDQAEAVLQAILKTEPDYTPARLVLAAGQLQAGQLDAVITAMQGLRDDATFADQAYTLLTRAYLAKKNGEQAEGAARAHLKASPTSPHAVLLLAQVLAELGHQRLALDVLTKAQAGQKTAELSMLRLALTERVSGAIAAETLARNLLTLEQSPALERALAALLIKQRRLPEAEAIFLNLSLTDPQALQTVAILQRDQARLPEAISTLERYLAAAPYSAGGWLRLALMRREALNFGGAIEAYEQLLRLEPNDAVGLNNLALLLAAQEQHARAAGLARRAAASMPENPAIQDTLGWVLTETGRPEVQEEARRVLERSARELGTQESRFHYGIVLARLGRKPEAAQELTAALAPEAQDLPWRARAEQTLNSVR